MSLPPPTLHLRPQSTRPQVSKLCPGRPLGQSEEISPARKEKYRPFGLVMKCVADFRRAVPVGVFIRRQLVHHCHTRESPKRGSSFFFLLIEDHSSSVDVSLDRSGVGPARLAFGDPQLMSCGPRLSSVRQFWWARVELNHFLVYSGIPLPLPLPFPASTETHPKHVPPQFHSPS